MSEVRTATESVPQIHHYINGTTLQQDGGRSLAVHDPAKGAVSAHLALADTAMTRRAIQAASEALPTWSAMTPLNRARVMFRYKALIEAHFEEIAQLITREHGKVIEDARGELTRGLEIVEFACGAPHLLKGEHSLNVGNGVDSYSMMQPVGVCAGITPFNFPAMVPMWMFPVALVCGNTFVLKPSEKDPSVPMYLAELMTEAGAPNGVLNVVNGDKEAVDTLLTDPDVSAISFVGSTPIAEHVYSTGSAHGKRVQALGGAKNHMVIMPDADLEGAVEALLGAAYGSAGERCMAISVAVVVGDAIGDRLVDHLKPRVQTLKIGDGLAEKGLEMGPLVTREHRDNVHRYVDLGEQEGATMVVDGRQREFRGEDGYFLGGTLFDHVKTDMRIYTDEIFGPVLCVVRVPDYESAVALVNENEFGNGTAIFTRDGDAARQFTSDVQAGMVGVNVPIPVPMAFHSFGGWKRSLFGPLHMHGPDGIRFYTQMKTVTARWPKGVRAGSAFNMPTME
ncbi:CoA-acylating methylmalonate-semialdehyde dehydrogenase [Spiribacter vilamensis]|uniref:methylmalonate-semialdehyde dehydrogenase (CoA acylating) n=1 Tax=Spiribacter vilamensis TaxID=531306 RepID=A0A4Q8D0F1_9GAMM|nr:CoA-acylating methylmalonate-semialdehyde dehydrogenase [Spiribacter vilamensis]RZU98789.1 malonate-semialdehyde dehydrogenase (acetylating)/methylmalonate-semialdehyde dehydrogenase [Spiribacter vilamensis]TVO62190.1 CoA-acylating methylmalonate-semialdehyde dehydrogenase [Spiribacter vilamensis]